MARYPAFCDGSFRVQSPVTSQTQLINWYTEIAEREGTVSQKTLLPTPGVEAFVTVTTATGGRAMYDTGSARTFGVVGSAFVEVHTGGTYTLRGTLAVDANPATIISNGDSGDQLFITSGDKGYNYTLSTNTLTTVLSSGATQGGMLYGYFVAFDKTNSQIFISDLFDGTVWDPTQFAENSISADSWQAMQVTAFGQICLVGSKTGQFWFNSGAFPFPFAPDPSALFQVGIAGAFSIKEVAGGVAWLATSTQGGYSVVLASGYSPAPISDKALEFELSQYTDLSDAIGDAYEEQGHTFYTLTLPDANVSWTYDFSTKQWHRRGTWITADNAYTYWRPVFHCFSFGKHLMADRESGVIYWMSNDFGSDVEDLEIRRLRRAPAINNNHLRLRFSRLELLVQAGLGNAEDENPQIMLRQSSDFGQTWGNETQTSLGRVGEFSQPVIFWRIGQARGKVFEVTTTARTPVRITDAYLHIMPSTEVA
jgi:hypothetical protein